MGISPEAWATRRDTIAEKLVNLKVGQTLEFSNGSSVYRIDQNTISYTTSEGERGTYPLGFGRFDGAIAGKLLGRRTSI